MTVVSVRNRVLAAMLGVFLIGCTGVPQGVTAVQPFNLNTYMGQWYEVARLDNRFERGLTEVTATYSLLPDGDVQVINRGFDAAEGEWKQAVGVAKFVDDEAKNAAKAELKVSFFGPFYASYNVVKLSDDQQMALVVGSDLSYAWLLSRVKTPAKAQCDAFLAKAADIGIDKDLWLQVQPCQ